MLHLALSWRSKFSQNTKYRAGTLGIQGWGIISGVFNIYSGGKNVAEHWFYEKRALFPLPLQMMSLTYVFPQVSQHPTPF